MPEKETEKTSGLLGRIISVVNQKGGVGKSTTAVNLSSYLSHFGYRTLLIDLDPQGNSSSGLGVYLENNDDSIYDVLINYRDLNNVIKTTQHEYLNILPSTTRLAGAEVELVTGFKREYRLKNAVDDIANLYDYIIIDCSPALGLLTLNALTASKDILIPLQCEYFALEGIARLIETIDLVKKNLNPGLEILGIVLTMFNKTKIAGQAAKEIYKYFSNKVFKTTIPRNVRLAEAPSYGKSILAYDPACSGANAYSRLTREVIASYDRSNGNDNDNNNENSDVNDYSNCNSSYNNNEKRYPVLNNICADSIPERIKNFWGSNKIPRHAVKKKKYQHQKN